jgi:hypothetical protein
VSATVIERFGAEYRLTWPGVGPAWQYLEG